MARWWFLRVLLNSSSFSATLLSISWRTWLSPAELSGPCSPPAQELPQPPQEHPGALPSPAQVFCAACQGQAVQEPHPEQPSGGTAQSCSCGLHSGKPQL